MEEIQNQIEEIVDRETRAWDTQDIDLLMTFLHPDMVWPWPNSPNSHNPMNWVLDWGRYNYERWKQGWQTLFDTHAPKHNHREIKKIVISKEMDGAFAVVDIDTLWLDKGGNKNYGKGRTCKVYTKMPSNEWKLIMHTGVLEY